MVLVHDRVSNRSCGRGRIRRFLSSLQDKGFAGDFPDASNNEKAPISYPIVYDTAAHDAPAPLQIEEVPEWIVSCEAPHLRVILRNLRISDVLSWL